MDILMTITPIYAAILAFIFIFLSAQVIKLRRIHQVSLGDNDVPALRKAIAVHSNFAQYVPFSLLLIAIVELNHAPAYLIHGQGIALVIARIAHAYGLAQPKQIMKLRQIGVIVTFTVMIFAALILLFQALRTFF